MVSNKDFFTIFTIKNSLLLTPEALNSLSGLPKEKLESIALKYKKNFGTGKLEINQLKEIIENKSKDNKTDINKIKSVETKFLNKKKFNLFNMNKFKELFLELEQKFSNKYKTIKISYIDLIIGENYKIFGYLKKIADKYFLCDFIDEINVEISIKLENYYLENYSPNLFEVEKNSFGKFFITKVISENTNAEIKELNSFYKNDIFQSKLKSLILYKDFKTLNFESENYLVIKLDFYNTLCNNILDQNFDLVDNKIIYRMVESSIKLELMCIKSFRNIIIINNFIEGELKIDDFQVFLIQVKYDL